MPSRPTRDEPFDTAAPFDCLPRLPPNQDVETRAILTACIDARVALAELNMAVRSIPSQAFPTSTLPILEACASAEIDYFITTTDRLCQYAGDVSEPTDHATKVAFR